METAIYKPVAARVLPFHYHLLHLTISHISSLPSSVKYFKLRKLSTLISQLMSIIASQV